MATHWGGQRQSRPTMRLRQAPPPAAHLGLHGVPPVSAGDLRAASPPGGPSCGRVGAAAPVDAQSPSLWVAPPLIPLPAPAPPAHYSAALCLPPAQRGSLQHHGSGQRVGAAVLRWLRVVHRVSMLGNAMIYLDAISCSKTADRGASRAPISCTGDKRARTDGGRSRDDAIRQLAATTHLLNTYDMPTSHTTHVYCDYHGTLMHLCVSPPSCTFPLALPNT